MGARWRQFRCCRCLPFRTAGPVKYDTTARGLLERCVPAHQDIKLSRREGRSFPSLLASRTSVNISCCAWVLFTRYSISLGETIVYVFTICCVIHRPLSITHFYFISLFLCLLSLSFYTRRRLMLMQASSWLSGIFHLPRDQEQCRVKLVLFLETLISSLFSILCFLNLCHR